MRGQGNLEEFKRDRSKPSGSPVLPSRVTYMAHGKGYVMCRRPGCMPFVLSEKEWERLPFWTPTGSPADEVAE